MSLVVRDEIVLMNWQFEKPRRHPPRPLPGNETHQPEFTCSYPLEIRRSRAVQQGLMIQAIFVMGGITCPVSFSRRSGTWRSCSSHQDGFLRCDNIILPAEDLPWLASLRQSRNYANTHSKTRRNKTSCGYAWLGGKIQHLLAENEPKRQNILSRLTTEL